MFPYTAILLLYSLVKLAMVLYITLKLFQHVKDEDLARVRLFFWGKEFSVLVLHFSFERSGVKGIIGDNMSLVSSGESMPSPNVASSLQYIYIYICTSQTIKIIP